MATFNVDLTKGICRVCGREQYIGEGKRCLRCNQLKEEKDFFKKRSK